MTTPRKKRPRVVTVRMPAELYTKARRFANKHNKSLNQLCVNLLTAATYEPPKD